MQCERCKVEMEKHTFKRGEAGTGDYYAETDKYSGFPVIARSVFICPKCGKMEFNINR